MQQNSYWCLNMSAVKERNIVTYCFRGENDTTPFPIVSLK